MTMKRMLGLVALTVLLATACAGSDSISATTTAAASFEYEQTTAAATTTMAGQDAGSPGGGEAQTGDLPDTVWPADLRIIREGEIQIRVPVGDFDTAWNRIRVVAANAGGYLSNAALGIDETVEGQRLAQGSATIRVPVDQFDAVLDRLGGVGERVSLSVSSTDVSEEFFDLEARLRHWKATEEFHLGLMDKAVTVADALKVQSELDQVQLEIERIQGRLNFLSDRTAYSTITVNLTEGPDSKVTEESEPSRIAQIWSDARGALLDAFGFILVALAAVSPFAAVAFTVLLILWGAKRIRQGRGETAPPAAGPETPPEPPEETGAGNGSAGH
jgi:hypothetical protein